MIMVTNWLNRYHDFASTYNPASTKHWLSSVKHHSFTIGLFYILFLILGPIYMRKRSGFNLRIPLLIWNLIVFLISLICLVNTSKDMFTSLIGNGFSYAICDHELVVYRPEKLNASCTSLWLMIYVITKPMLMIDTVFIVLRKRSVPVIHWLHHMLAVIGTWYLGDHWSSLVRWLVLLNLAEHIVLYFYFALRTLEIKFLRFIPMFVTLIQLFHFGTAVIMTGYISLIKFFGYECKVNIPDCLPVLIVYSTLLYFYMNFFLKTYIRSSPTVNKEEKLQKSPSKWG